MKNLCLQLFNYTINTCNLKFCDTFI
jgi:hypothetical protein